MRFPHSLVFVLSVLLAACAPTQRIVVVTGASIAPTAMTVATLVPTAIPSSTQTPTFTASATLPL